jgi:hypothetical protein
MMEAVSSSEMSVSIHQTAQRSIPGDIHLHFNFLLPTIRSTDMTALRIVEVGENIAPFSLYSDRYLGNTLILKGVNVISSPISWYLLNYEYVVLYDTDIIKH